LSRTEREKEPSTSSSNREEAGIIEYALGIEILSMRGKHAPLPF
jgi:hypothetical protein